MVEGKPGPKLDRPCSWRQVSGQGVTLKNSPYRTPVVRGIHTQCIAKQKTAFQNNRIGLFRLWWHVDKDLHHRLSEIAHPPRARCRLMCTKNKLRRTDTLTFPGRSFPGPSLDRAESRKTVALVFTLFRGSFGVNILIFLAIRRATQS